MHNLRKYGSPPFKVAVIHGGPGAPGNMAPVARKLAGICGILEPLQTMASIDGQIQELKSVLDKNNSLPITLIGHSWGAWLGFIFAAHFPSYVNKILLVGSGPFEEKYASQLMETRFNRLNEDERSKVHSLMKDMNDKNVSKKNEIMAEFGKLMSKADSFDLLPIKNEVIEYQYDIFQSVWQEASELRQSGKLLELGTKIKCPTVAIHGDHDSHSGEGIKKPLSKIIRDFRFYKLEKCGHAPWKERFAHQKFYDILKKELEYI